MPMFNETFPGRKDEPTPKQKRITREHFLFENYRLETFHKVKSLLSGIIGQPLNESDAQEVYSLVLRDPSISRKSED
ncbi:hypothetical protein JXA63_03275 [Candidatus Woesebacteria bacterium]|nr:hypothetical protein [Candidatus Woesebacteria bacterium]